VPKRVIVLSGPIKAGKSTLSATLHTRYGAHVFKTQHVIRQLRGAALERSALQAAGEALDQETGGRWVADELTRMLQTLPEDAIVVVDSARIRDQIVRIREAFGSRVAHVHLTAPPDVLAERYREPGGSVRELETYAAAQSNPTEAQVGSLAEIADIVIDTRRSTKEDVVVRVAAQLGFYGRGYDRLVDVLIGGQYGSEGKGNIAQFLADEYQVLVRVGGPNAGHKVYEEVDGQPHPYTHHMLPSGTRRNTSAQVVIGAGAVLWVPSLMQEIADCEMSFDRLAIDPQAMVILPEDRQREVELVTGIASTGQGVGAATVRKIWRTSAQPPVTLARDVVELRPYIRPTSEVLDDAFAAGKHVFLEGTQGAGLSIHHGHYPHVTSRDTTVSGCLAEAGIPPGRVRRTIMLCRTYPIRVQNPTAGTSGYMSREITLEEISRRSGVSLAELEKTERTSTTNRERRIAEFDWALLRRAASLNSPSDIALSFADYISVENRKARRFEQLTPETIQLIEEVERVSRAPVSLISVRFDFRNIIDRRTW
jgi:adenylosuccinate synthase